MTAPLLTLMVLIVAFSAALRQAQGRLAVPGLSLSKADGQPARAR